MEPGLLSATYAIAGVATIGRRVAARIVPFVRNWRGDMP